MIRRVLLLDVDGTLIAWPRAGQEPPAGAVQLGADAGLAARAWVQPRVLDTLRGIAATGTEITWSTAWLALPDEELDALSAALGLDGVVRRPTPAEFGRGVVPHRLHPPTTSAAAFRRHWKVKLVHRFARQGEVMALDDAYGGAEPWLPEGAGFIVPRAGVGLTPEDADVLAAWARSEAPLPRRTWYPEGGE